MEIKPEAERNSLPFIVSKNETDVKMGYEINKPPITLAGPQQVIILPTGSVLLDGSTPSNPDGRISNYHWNPAPRTGRALLLLKEDRRFLSNLKD